MAVSLAYFFVPIRDGLVLTGQDHDAAVGSGVEMAQYRAEHNGERTRWTNTLFSGMPTYQMSPSYPSTELLGRMETFYQLGLPTVAAYVFMMLLGFYIFLRAFDFRSWMAALGAVLWAFSSYYFIIIAAGHIWKLLTLCFIPPTIGGMVLCYRGRYLQGLVVTGIFTAFQILSNHVQMTYYFLFVIGFMALAFFLQALRQHQLREWMLGTASFAVGGILGVCVNLSNLYHTWEYSKESMRGKSELTQKTKDPADQTSSGLERSYITAWSYGLGETWTLLVPNTKGGASDVLANNETAMKHANSTYAPIYRGFSQYWGEQPGTSGPVYVGAFVLMLFVLGLLIVRGPMKWCLLAATVLSILLSWGKNFMGFTDFFLDYVPMYDKFRTVASILVIAEFTIPLLAMMALRTFIEGKDSPEFRRPFLISLAVTGGFCLLFWLLPDVFFGSYLSQSDTAYMHQYVQAGYVPQEMAAGILDNMSQMRRAMFTSDALRSLIVILLGALLMALYRWGKMRAVPMVLGITLLCLVDMWGINKRYLNDGMFCVPRSTEKAFPRTQADETILQDTDPDYRVLNLSVNTFNDNTTSYYHKSIGGYHAAKLRRYQELIEQHLVPEIQAVKQAVSEHQGQLAEAPADSLFPVLNMLNTRYVILPVKEGDPIAIPNPWAMGNAWWVDAVQYVPDADAEIASLRSINPRHTAVVDEQFRSVLGEVEGAVDSTATITLTRYEANRLTYEANSNREGVLVFSEIYYPGWTCTVDGQDTPIARADYVLRAIRLQPGKHTIVLSFDPRTVHVTEAIAYTAGILLILLLAGYGIYAGRKRKENS
uniref:Putative membrane protein n=1 Tax=uncultured bacterium fosmid pJB135F11 TaxID=1478051 RepID=A0A0H3U8L0_9BACT|nr:putative membrane protein [uncultured bacterium fosmid pJB135F11]